MLGPSRRHALVVSRRICDMPSGLVRFANPPVQDLVQMRLYGGRILDLGIFSRLERQPRQYYLHACFLGRLKILLPVGFRIWIGIAQL